MSQSVSIVRWFVACFLATCAMQVLVPTARAQEIADPADSVEPSAPAVESVTPAEPPAPAAQLAKQQEAVAEKYRRLEMLMLRMAEFDANSNPRRATLLKQALAKSKEQRISADMQQLVAILLQQELQQAVDQQTEVRTHLQQLLDLLQTEDRSERLRSEQERVRSYIQQLERILRQQRGIEGRTEGGDELPRLAQEQAKLADNAGELSQKIKTDEERAPNSNAPTPPGPGKNEVPNPDSPAGDPSATPPEGDANKTPGADPPAKQDDNSPPNDSKDRDKPESKPNESQSDESPDKDAAPKSTGEQEGRPAETPSGDKPPTPDEGSAPANPPENAEENAPNEPTPDDAAPQEGQPSPSGAPHATPPRPGSPGESQPSDRQTPPQPSEAAPEFPGRKKIEAARDKMREAQKRLEESQRQEARGPQEEARRLLEQAKAELEEILRQMREEEVQRTLADLESRFRKMLEWQIKVFEETKQLDSLPPEQRTSQLVVQAGKLSLDERKILGEADKALLLLREEGSSVAFPEAVEQLRGDMAVVVERLAQVKVDVITQGLESDIIAAIEELIATLQKAQEDAEKRQNQPQPGEQPGESKEMPLVDAIAELKMIRTLQVRVNKRTLDYSQQLAEPNQEIGQATTNDLVEGLRQLSQREDRIRQLTRDLVLGKNQ